MNDPHDYAGQPVCPGCGSGWPVCVDSKPLDGTYSHEETCARYAWSNSVCGNCERRIG